VIFERIQRERLDSIFIDRPNEAAVTLLLKACAGCAFVDITVAETVRKSIEEQVNY